MSIFKRYPSLEVLRLPEFRAYLFARLFFILVINMQATLISWKVFEITRDPLSIGLIGLVEFLPAVAMAFYAGHVIDNGDKRRLLIMSLAGNLVLTIAFALLTSEYGTRNLPQDAVLVGIYGIAFCTGLARAFSGPTSFAIVSQLVPREQLPSGITWHSGTWQVSAVSGPAIAGILYASKGITFTFLLMIGCMCLALAGTFLLRPKPPAPRERQESVLQSIREGFRFVWRSKEVFSVISLDLLAVFFGGATALLPYFSEVVLQKGPEGLGILRSAPSLGAIAILLFLAARPLNGNQGRTMLLSVAGFGACIIIFGLSRDFRLSVAALFLSGVLDGISIIVRSTILQVRTPDEMRGRVASLNSIFIMSSNELGAFESGFTAKILGYVPAVVFGGCMTIAVTVATWLKSPEVRKLEY